MNEHDKTAIESAGFRVGNFEDFLGIDEVEARIIAHRADLGAAIRRARMASGLTQSAFGKRVGVSQSKLARIEIGAPEVSIDLMTSVHLKAGGGLSIVVVKVEHPEREAPAKLATTKKGEPVAGRASQSRKAKHGH